MKKTNWAIWIVIFLIAFFTAYNLTKGEDKIIVEEELAKCIGDNSIYYMQTGCPACEQQKELFGNSYKHLTTINCKTNPTACTTNAITSTPTWSIKGEKTIGVKTIEELKEMTGC